MPLELPAWYRPSNSTTRAEQYTCPVCAQKYAGKFFLRFSEAHPDLYPEPKQKARKKIIDLRACRFCHLKQYQRDYARTLREREAEAIRKAHAFAIEKGIPITDPRLIPPEARPKRVLNRWGHEPVLHYCRILYKASSVKCKEIERKVDTLLMAGCHELEALEKEGVDPVIDALRAQYKLYALRIKAALHIRQARHTDLQSGVVEADPTRADPFAYLPVEMKAKLIRAAHKANEKRIGIVMPGTKITAASARVGRPFTWMPRYLSASQDMDLVRKAWSLIIARAKHSQSKAAKYLRSVVGRRKPRVFTMDAALIKGDYDVLTFTAEQFYREVGDATYLALDKIEQAIDSGVMPTSYTLGEQDVINHWEELVPLHRQRIRDMRTGFDARTRYYMDTFSRHFIPKILHSMHSDDPRVIEAEKKRKRNPFQIEHKLDHNNVPLPEALVHE
jgi:hypothetical protein